jgi:hypothetical protein
MTMANEQQDSHITEMYYCENAHYFTGHGTYTGDCTCPVVNRFPKTDGDGHIAEVQQIISGQQRTVYEQRKLFISMKQVENIAFSIPVKDQSHVYCYKPGNEKIDDVRQRVHNIMVFYFDYALQDKDNNIFQTFNIF